MLGDDLDAHLSHDVAVNLHRYRELTERLDRFGQRDLPLFDLESLRLEGVRDVGGGHRSVQRVVLADPPRDLDLGLRDPLRHALGLLALFGVARLGRLLLALDLALVGLGHGEGQLARQQVVARVALRDLHHVAAAPKVVDMLSQNDFHVILSGGVEAIGEF